MKKECCTIAVFGLFGSSNFGNEATLEGFLHNLQQRIPGAGIVSIVPRSHAIDPTHGLRRLDMDPMPVDAMLWRIKPAWLRRAATSAATIVSEPLRRRQAAKLLEGVTLLFVPGTGVIDDFGQGPLDIPLHLDRWTAAAAAVGARVIFVSIGASTVKNRLSRRLFLRSLRRAAYCSFRDQVSCDNARALGYDARAVVPDLAFSLPQQRHKAEIAWPPQTIGVGVMGYFGWNLTRAQGERVYREYIEKMRVMINRLIAQGYSVRLLIGDTVADQRAVSDLAKADERLIASALKNHHDLIDAIALCDIVVATRYHNVLFSLMAGRPTVSIGYADKNDALVRDMNLGRYCHTIETLDVDTLIAQIAEIAASNQSPATELRERAGLLRTQVIDQYQTLVTVCDRSSRSAR